jgi:hypothetical protein
MKPQCAWTGVRTADAVPITIPGVDRFGRNVPPRTVRVLPEHADDLMSFADRVRRYGRLFLGAITVLTIGMVAAVILLMADVVAESTAARVVGVLVALLGMLGVSMPFTTPETIGAFGVRRSIVVARVLGVITIALGAMIALIA